MEQKKDSRKDPTDWIRTKFTQFQKWKTLLKKDMSFQTQPVPYDEQVESYFEEKNMIDSFSFPYSGSEIEKQSLLYNMKMKLKKKTPENEMQLKVLRGSTLSYTERTLWLKINEYLLQQEERKYLASFKQYGVSVLLGQISFCGIGSLLFSCFIDIRLSKYFKFLKNPPAKILSFVSSYLILSSLYHFSRREGLRMFSEEMVQKYKEESKNALIKTYQKGISLEMNKEANAITIKK